VHVPFVRRQLDGSVLPLHVDVALVGLDPHVPLESRDVDVGLVVLDMQPCGCRNPETVADVRVRVAGRVEIVDVEGDRLEILQRVVVGTDRELRRAGVDVHLGQPDPLRLLSRGSAHRVRLD
jgi:hypothetical protein